MHITDLETFVCSYRFPEADRWYAGGKDDKEPVAGHFNAIIVRLHTNEGLTGLGEVMPWSDLDTRIDALQNIVRPRLIGRSPLMLIYLQRLARISTPISASQGPTSPAGTLWARPPTLRSIVYSTVTPWPNPASAAMPAVVSDGPGSTDRMIWSMKPWPIGKPGLPP